MIQANINQNLPANIISAQETVEEMTNAIIRTPSGRKIVIDWSVQNNNRSTAEVMKKVFETSGQTASIQNQENDEEKADEEVQDAEKKAAGTKEETSNIKNADAAKNKEQSKSDEVQQEDAIKKAIIEAEKQLPKEKEPNDQASTTTKTSGTMNIKTHNNEVILKTNYFLSTKNALYLQTYVGGKVEKNGSWVNASENEIKKYFLPDQNNINKYKYQFLSLEKTAGISVKDAGSFLKGKGILNGKESIFLAAAKANNINEIYLMAHACLETGNGTSKLATGVSYGGQVVYNMFGIGAYDNNAVTKGAQYAYKAGWTTPEKAIMGGAKFISENYINNSIYKQDTLYEMRWNPGSPGSHQYATDVAWATKQAVWIEQIYKKFNDPHVIFDIPVYMAGK